MKKHLMMGSISLAAALLLLADALTFCAQIANGTGDGTGLYLFFGLWEFNDTIPYSVAPYYACGLCLITGALFVTGAVLAAKAARAFVVSDRK